MKFREALVLILLAAIWGASFLCMRVSTPAFGPLALVFTRVAIASALLHDPEVFVIDEPMVGLDPQHARVVKDVLKERSLRGMTVFLSTHQLSVAEELADRVGIIHQGKVVAIGTPAELRTQSGQEGPLEKAFLALTAEEGKQGGTKP